MDEESPIAKKVLYTLDQLKKDTFDEEKQVIAANNLMVLCKEHAGSRFVIEKEGIQLIHTLIAERKSLEVKVALARVLSEICRHEPDFVRKILNRFKMDGLVDLMNQVSDQLHYVRFELTIVFYSLKLKSILWRFST